MERTMSVEDKIRKAEEIYYRRRNQEIPYKEAITKEPVKVKRNINLLNKMIKQIIICLLIYSIFYAIINNNYIFSEDFTQKAREILSQDINFSQIFFLFSNSIKKENQTTTDEKQDNSDKQKTKEEIQTNEENIGGAEELLLIEQQNEIDIGGAEEELAIEQQDEGTISSQEVSNQENEQVEEIPQLSQMEQDANYIKSTISFIKPIEGTISSMFGLRNPTTESVPKNHTGTDIAAVTGTKIISATDGTVIFSASKGDFGKHIKIQINDVIVVYAHCNKLYVKEGDTIKQGQEIAEVGSTGNTTGPHLHFEVRYEDRYVDPQLILQL